MVKRILVVEDDLSLKPLWESFFSRRSQQVQMDWVVSCEEARKIIKKANEEKNPFYLIITDIFLAGSGTGMELLRSPEVMNSQARTVLVSAADRYEILSKFGHLMPNTEVISKPLDFRKYEPILNHLLTR
ncbi:response regulator [Pseudobdellovibrio exovorus]|uniref:Response regulatory domain-containing protein n=1 Tax=Pseudobdellovibrio exovorus JSS TaxID=1184267 RepID=M4VR49_9BACT|nr:response regulator [Pseudobdellovibrio exovorus]AGH95649.1 hypothetical protein A11Q_1433 [Pseudobdellovibrio exovorus JSS]